MKLIGLVVTLLIPIMLSSGCSTSIKEEPIVKVVEVEKQKPKLNLPPVTSIKSLPTDWKVVTEDNVSDVFSEIKETNNSAVIYGLDQKNYENVSINMANILKLIQELRSHVEAYKNYYETE